MAERRNYQARPKAKPDEEGHVRLSCPAANPWPLVCCELKRGSLTPQTTGRMRLQLKSDLKVNPPPSCSQQSVTIPPEAGAKFGQELLHGSAEWHTAYSRLRSINEGFNGYVKDPALEALDDPARHRLHGVAQQTVLTALLLAAAISAKSAPSCRRLQWPVLASPRVAHAVVAALEFKTGAHQPATDLAHRRPIRRLRPETPPHLS